MRIFSLRYCRRGSPHLSLGDGAAFSQLLVGAVFQPLAVEADSVFQFASGGKVGKAFHGTCRDVRQRLFGKKDLMRTHNHVGESREPRQNIILHQLVRAVFKEVFALFLVDIQSCSVDLAAFRPIHQRAALSTSLP